MKIKQKIWINKTCEDCLYQIDGLCRLNPPVHISGTDTFSFSFIMKHKSFASFFPAVLDKDQRYQMTCSKWEENSDTT